MANIGPDNFELVKELLGDKNTMNRSTLEEVLFEELGFSREMSRVFVTQFFQTISDVLATGEEVKLTTLGRFEICGRAYKMFFDPEAKEWFDAPTRLDVYFHPSKKLTDFIDYNLPIREASSLCGVKDYVLRFWEKEFSQLRPMKRGSQRAYRAKDILIARRIRELLYGEGYRIDAAREILNKEDREAKAGASAPQLPEAYLPGFDGAGAFAQPEIDWDEFDSVVYNLEKIEEFLHN